LTARRRSTNGSAGGSTGQYDENWPDWYAEYMVREQSGETPPV
jgi:hypothetical protein